MFHVVKNFGMGLFLAPRAGGCRLFTLSNSWFTLKLSALRRCVDGHGKPIVAPLALWDEVVDIDQWSCACMICATVAVAVRAVCGD